MATTKTNASVESIISDPADHTNNEINKNDDRFYIALTSLALIGLVTLLIFALV
ncbi:hypothetical protein [Reichenbachiella sp.]|uniref:hypothetical protein n=1 Tax=Reichenbachiella sp. TaxID=2184521 RepID=UPI003BB0D867